MFLKFLPESRVEGQVLSQNQFKYKPKQKLVPLQYVLVFDIVVFAESVILSNSFFPCKCS